MGGPWHQLAVLARQAVSTDGQQEGPLRVEEIIGE